MADNDLRMTIVADDEASRVIDGVTQKAEKLDKLNPEVDISADAKKAERTVSDLIKDTAKLDKETATIVLAIKAGDVERQLKETAIAIAGLDGESVEIEAELEHANELKGDLDEITSKIKELNATDVNPNTKPAVEGIQAVEKTAESSKNVLANMVGNSAQDIGEVGGIAGSTGVAIGQMAEYFSDATLAGEGMASALKNMALIAGPILLLATATQVVSGVLAENARRAQEAQERTDLLGESMREASDDAAGLSDGLRENIDDLRDFEATALLGGEGIINTMNDIAKKIPIVGGLISQDLGVNVVDALNKAETSMFKFSKAITGTSAEGQAFADSMFAAFKAGKISGDEYRAIVQAINQYRKAAADARKEQQLFNVDAAEANAIIGELASQADPLSQFADVWAAIFDDMRDGAVDSEATAAQINALAAALGLTQEEVIKLAQEHLDEEMKSAAEQTSALVDGLDAVNKAFDGTDERVDALGRSFDKFNRDSDLNFSQMATNTVQSFDDVKEALKGVQDIGSKPLVPTTVEDLRGLSDESAAVVDSIAGLRDSIQLELTAALEQGGGKFDSLREKAGFFRGEITTQFTSAFEAMGLSSDEVDEKVTELLGSLGLLPSQVETQIKITKDQEAMKKIELFSSALDDLPPEVQSQVVALVEEGNPQAAWQLVQDEIKKKGDIALNSKLEDPDNVDDVAANAQQKANQKPIKFNSELRPLKGAFSGGGVVGPTGGVAGEAGAEFVTLPDGSRVLLVGATAVPPRSRVTSTAQTARQLASMSSFVEQPVQNIRQTINVNLPRGARYTDIARAMQSHTRRAGRRYAAPHPVVTYARR